MEHSKQPIRKSKRFKEKENREPAPTPGTKRWYDWLEEEE